MRARAIYALCLGLVLLAPLASADVPTQPPAPLTLTPGGIPLVSWGGVPLLTEADLEVADLFASSQIGVWHVHDDHGRKLLEGTRSDKRLGAITSRVLLLNDRSLLCTWTASLSEDALVRPAQFRVVLDLIGLDGAQYFFRRSGAPDLAGTLHTTPLAATLPQWTSCLGVSFELPDAVVELSATSDVGELRAGPLRSEGRWALALVADYPQG
ncbi:MAG: hypothetical protein V2A58_08380, partial [Planctomycetota bacterium]